MAGEMRFVIVVGDSGTGKSSLIRSYIADEQPKPDHGDGPDCVTTKTDVFQSLEDGIQLIDTVGLNLPGSDLGLPMALVEGQLVHFVVLLNNRRWLAQFKAVRDKLKWAKPSENISKWAAHGASFAASQARAAAAPGVSDISPPILSYFPKRLEALGFQRVPKREPEPAPLTAAASAPKIPKPLQKPAIKTAAAPPCSMSKQWFGREVDELSEHHKELHKAWDALGWSLPKQRKMAVKDWLIVPSLEVMQQHRRSGEHLLEFHLLKMFGHTNDAQNESLKAVVKNVVGLEDHINHLYTHANQKNVMSDEKYADYLEALFELLLMDHRRLIVDFLNTCGRLNY